MTEPSIGDVRNSANLLIDVGLIILVPIPVLTSRFSGGFNFSIHFRREFVETFAVVLKPLDNGRQRSWNAAAFVGIALSGNRDAFVGSVGDDNRNSHNESQDEDDHQLDGKCIWVRYLAHRVIPRLLHVRRYV